MKKLLVVISCLLIAAVAFAGTISHHFVSAAVDNLTVTTATMDNLTLNGLLNGRTTSFRGALATKSATQALTTETATLLTFDEESYDTSDCHSTITNTGRMTVPTGVTKVRLIGQVTFAANDNGARSLAIYKNASDYGYAGAAMVYTAPASPAGETILNVSSPILAVVAGDYFTLYATQSSGGELNALGVVAGCYTWFAMEVVE